MKPAANLAAIPVTTLGVTGCFWLKVSKTSRADPQAFGDFRVVAVVVVVSIWKKGASEIRAGTQCPWSLLLFSKCVFVVVVDVVLTGSG